LKEVAASRTFVSREAVAKRSDAVKEARAAFDAAQREYRQRVRAAHEALENARRDREAALKNANKELGSAQSDYDRRVQAAEKHFRERRQGSLVASYGSVKLYENRLETLEGTTPLSAEIRATVDASGLKTDKADTRETVLLLDTPTHDSVIRVNPNDTTAVREFAAKINTAAKNAAAQISKYEHAHAAARENLARARADTAARDQAAAALARLEADTQTVDAAAANLREAEEDKREVEARRVALLEVDPSAKVREISAPGRSWRSRAASKLWRRRGWKGRAAIVGGTVLAFLILLGALVDEQPSNGPTEAVDTTLDESAVTPISLALGHQNTVTVRKPTYLVRGSVAEDAAVRLNGRVVPHTGTSFRKRVALRLGRNVFKLTATMAGSPSATRTIRIQRLKPFLPLRVTSGGGTVYGPEFTLRGVAVPGAKITVRGRPASLDGSRFSAQVSVSPGRNALFIRAVHPRYAPSGRKVTVVRKLTVAERRAIAEQERQNFINATTSISYAQLSKNPDRYKGTKVRYYGEILQIQEDALGGFMLLSVTNLGYDVWTDNVWVNYEGSIRGAEGDKVTIYGVVAGTKEYDTQIGGQTYDRRLTLATSRNSERRHAPAGTWGRFCSSSASAVVRHSS
jgi:hypothetical protein